MTDHSPEIDEAAGSDDEARAAYVDLVMRAAKLPDLEPPPGAIDRLNAALDRAIRRRDRRDALLYGLVAIALCAAWLYLWLR